jgi:membrane protein DedA with SNARE-associated domain
VEQFYTWIVQNIEVWGYAAIIIGMALESACLPVPSELIFAFAGYQVFLGRMDFTTAVIAGVAGGLIGSIVSYWVGYFGGQPLVDKYGRYMFISKQQVATAQRWFDRYGLKAAFWARLLPIVRTFISLPAGFARVDFVKFVVYTICGSVLWTSGLIYAGMLLGENWREVETIGHEATILLGAGLVLLVIIWVKSHKGNGSSAKCSRKSKQGLRM